MCNQLPLEGAREHLRTFFMAQADGEIVGCAGLELHSDVALLRSVAVGVGLHRQGIGRLMVSNLISQAEHRNCKALYLLTTTARHYFQRQGFMMLNRAEAPVPLLNSAEFQGVCSASAEFMVLRLEPSTFRGLCNHPGCAK